MGFLKAKLSKYVYPCLGPAHDIEYLVIWVNVTFVVKGVNVFVLY